MSHNTSYPSPSAAQVGEGAGPFYQQAPRVAPQEDLELTAHLSREMAPNANQNASGNQELQRMDQKFSQPLYAAQIPSYPQMSPAQHGTPTQGPNTPTNARGEESSARKKSKVSRACDECRRKKIRCDAEPDAPNHPRCTNCQRTQTGCQFSRQPMKRGPSKGYIKELADRLDQMEKRVTGGSSPYTAMSPTSPQAGNDYGIGDDVQFGQKRTHSMSESLSAQAYAQSQMQRAQERYPPNGGWQNHHGVNQPVQAYDDNKPQAPIAVMNYNPVGLDFAMPTNGIPQPAQLDLFTGPVLAPRTGDTSAATRYAPWQERLIAEYFRILHPTLPLLASTPDNVRNTISACSEVTRGAFFGALSMVATRSSAYVDDAESNVVELNALITPEHSTIPDDAQVQRLVFFQICTLVIIAIDMNGPVSHQPNEIPPRSIWLGLAQGMVQQFKLYQAENPNHKVLHPDSVWAMRRRTYMALVVVDRFYAAGMASPPSFQDYATKLLASDMQIFPRPFYQLTRLSRVLTHLVRACILPISIFSAGFGPDNAELFCSILTGELESFMESISGLDNDPGLIIAIEHTKLLHARCLANPANPVPSDINGIARHIAKLVNHDTYPVNPFTHHFVALAGKTLMELTDLPSSRPGAAGGLKDLYEAIGRKGRLASKTDPEHGAGCRVWEGLIQMALEAKIQTLDSEPMDKANLQHLADAAVGGSADEQDMAATAAAVGAGGKIVDWSALARKGYLAVYQ